MADKKLVDTKYVEVTVGLRNPESETGSNFVGGVVIENGKPTIKHYKFQLDEKISIPEPFVAQLKNRSYVGKAKDGSRALVSVYIVEKD